MWVTVTSAQNERTNRHTRPAHTAHLDTFCADRMPPPEQLPSFFRDLPEYSYPERLNCAAELLDRMVVGGSGERTAFIHELGLWTYRRLLEAANRIARVLLEDCELVSGNRVLLRGPNHPMLVACWLAVVKAGGVAVTTPWLLRCRELVSVADKGQITLALCDARYAGDCEDAFARHADGSARPNARIVLFNSDSPDSLEALMATKPGEFRNCDSSCEDVAMLAFTSGSTGQPKGTMHTHRDVLAAADCFPRYVLKASADDVFIGSPPLGFTYGLGGLVLFPMRTGASTVLLEQSSPGHLLEGIARYRASVCFTAPTAYRAMLKQLSRPQVASLRKCVSAGETLPLSTFEAWHEATGGKIIDGIGSTEMLQIFISAPEEQIRPGATGRAIHGYEAKIVRDDGTDAAPGEVGRLAVRGVTGCKYLDNEREQAKYVQNGWNLTGDSFRMDQDGYFWFQARTDDLIVSSGYNIAGIEVENVLLEHPSVQECAVIGVPDSDRGQVLKAFVVTTANYPPCEQLKKELQDFVKSQIAPFKYPRSLEFVASLPRTATGKLQRFELRKKSE
ncbi:MAG: 2-aminobenzoate-CoA ligase [Acidobacteria bacterium]|nr:MAG: 2-aminobenzoate-CoA ligase [Acidobacteriota bacterium]PYY19952.1 MAG: 2-aminobenzoate-CoA ligase [Acidobacteriota bacterium]